MVIFNCLMRGHCCKKFWIPVTHLDLLRIREYGGIEITRDIVSLYEAELYEDLFYPRVSLGGREYFLALASRSDGSCIFLDNGKCSIHRFKPYVCRFYPFVYVEKDDDVDIEVNENAIGECPGLILDNDNIPIDLKNTLKMYARIRIQELKLYERVVDDWNRSELSANGDIDYLLQYILGRAVYDKKYLESIGMWHI